MKYTIRHVKKFLEQGTIDPVLWTEHFPTLIDTRVPGCRDCEDYKKKTLRGRQKSGRLFSFHKTQTRPGARGLRPVMNPKGKNQNLPTGAAKFMTDARLRWQTKHTTSQRCEAGSALLTVSVLSFFFNELFMR